MDFGKLGDISRVNFSLPPDAAENEIIWQQLPQKQEAKVRIYVGCTGWAMKEWVGKTYPKNIKSTEFLKYYGLQFNTIELNTTHYRTPSVATVQEWCKAVPDDFRFCPKVLQAISHSADLGLNGREIGYFWEAITAFGNKLGNCFMQLPPQFRWQHLVILERFFEQLPANIPFSVEIRHESWFQSEKYKRDFFELLKNFGISTVITDVAGRRDVLHQRLTTRTALLRFVGNATPKALHETDKTRIDEWITRIKIWIDKGLSELYFFTHEPDNLLAPELAQYTCQKIEEQIGKNRLLLRGVTFFDDAPAQMSLF